MRRASATIARLAPRRRAIFVAHVRSQLARPLAMHHDGCCMAQRASKVDVARLGDPARDIAFSRPVARGRQADPREPGRVIDSGSIGQCVDCRMLAGCHIQSRLQTVPLRSNPLAETNDGPIRSTLKFRAFLVPLRVARRMSFTTCSAGDFVVTGFFLISTSTWGQDEPETLRYAIRPNCSVGADFGQPSLSERSGSASHSHQPLSCSAIANTASD
jgi:hypothetical protein